MIAAVQTLSWAQLATMADSRGVDISHFETSDGRSIRQAINYLAPFAMHEKPWPYQQINPDKVQDYYKLLVVADEQFKNAGYGRQAASIKVSNKNTLVKILYEK